MLAAVGRAESDVCVQCDVSRVTAMVLAGLPARSEASAVFVG